MLNLDVATLINTAFTIMVMGTTWRSISSYGIRSSDSFEMKGSTDSFEEGCRYNITIETSIAIAFATTRAMQGS